MNRKITTLILAMLLCLPMWASAATSSDSWFGGNFSNDAVAALSSLQVGVDKFVTNFQAGTAGISFKLFGVLATISIAWCGIKLTLASGSSLSEPMAKLVQTIFMVGLCYFLIGDGYQTLTGFITGLCDQLASLALPGGSSFQSGFVNLSQSLWSMIDQVWSAPDNREWWQKLITAGFDFGIKTILTFLLSIIIVVFSLIAMAGIMSVILTVGIALSLGKVLIPFLILPNTNFIYDGWLKFTIAAILAKVVIAMIIAISLFVLDALLHSGVSQMSVLILGSAFSIMAAFQLLKAPQIAQSIVAGGAVGFDQFTRSAADTAKKLGGGQ